MTRGYILLQHFSWKKRYKIHNNTVCVYYVCHELAPLDYTNSSLIMPSTAWSESRFREDQISLTTTSMDSKSAAGLTEDDRQKMIMSKCGDHLSKALYVEGSMLNFAASETHWPWKNRTKTSWKKSCTLDGWNPVNKGINHRLIGAGFLPSTVSKTIPWFRTSPSPQMQMPYPAPHLCIDAENVSGRNSRRSTRQSKSAQCSCAALETSWKMGLPQRLDVFFRGTSY